MCIWKSKFQIIYKKGYQQREVLRFIKNIALYFWREQVSGSVTNPDNSGPLAEKKRTKIHGLKG